MTMMEKNSNAKKVAYFGLGIALYVVLSMMVKIPLIAHIQTDLGYIVFCVYLCLFGGPAVVVGIIGCLIESLIVNGWVPVGWMVGQAFIGIVCGMTFQKHQHKAVRIFAIIISVFIGIGLIKTGIECVLYGIPFPVKFARNGVAAVADGVVMIIGLWVADLVKNRLR